MPTLLSRHFYFHPNRRKGKEKGMFRYELVEISFVTLKDLTRQINVKYPGWEVVQLFAFSPSDAITQGTGNVIVLFKVRVVA